MDAALLLIAGNEPCPQPQTSEHLAAVEIMKLNHMIILQNKIDLVKEAAALQQHDDIKAFVKGTVADNSPIVPISAQLRYNIDVVAEYITNSVIAPPWPPSAAPPQAPPRRPPTARPPLRRSRCLCATSPASPR